MSSDNFSRNARGKRWWDSVHYIVEIRTKNGAVSPYQKIRESPREAAERAIYDARRLNPGYDFRLTEVRYGPWEEKEE